MKVTLPDLPSELLTLALNDLILVEKEAKKKKNNITVDMRTWYKNDYAGCVVCLAGAVIRNELLPEDFLTDNYGIRPDSFNEDTGHKLYAIDHLRQGQIKSALCAMNIIHNKHHLINRHIPVYGPTPIRNTKFKKAIRQLIKDLKKEGL